LHFKLPLLLRQQTSRSTNMSARNTGKIPAARRGELDVAAAVAREAVMQLHVERSLRLIDLVSGRVAPLRALDMYARLLSLTGTMREMVTNRVLAALGQAAAVPQRAASDEPASAARASQVDAPSLWATLRRRLRGREHDELRRAVELHTGVTLKALLDVHVEHARRFVALLGESVRMDHACDIYDELVEVPSSLTAVLYPLVLDRIAAEELPLRWNSATQRSRVSTVA
jgi:hypothetical protein